MKKRLIIAAICFVILTNQPLRAQMANDGFTMGKGEVCLVTDYMQSSFTKYWEGKRLRENLNLGKFTSKEIMPMAAFGITNKLTAFAGVPYINNSSSAGTMTGKKGWQDLSLDVKYQFLNKPGNKWTYKLFVTGGFSFPITKYTPDFLPFSIGLGTKNLSGRIIAHVVYSNKWFTTFQSGYILRSNITVDRQSYFTDGQHNSNQMKIPNVWDGAFHVGYNVKRFRVAVHLNWNQSTSGSDMRRNDMPYPDNQMNMLSTGIMGLLWIPKVEGLALHAGIDQVLTGKNVGKSFMWMTGIQYVFTPFNSKEHAK